jgi:hypothetical protein
MTRCYQSGIAAKGQKAISATRKKQKRNWKIQQEGFESVGRRGWHPTWIASEVSISQLDIGFDQFAEERKGHQTMPISVSLGKRFSHNARPAGDHP